MKRNQSPESAIAKGFIAFGVVWLLAALASLAGVAVLAYIILHFVAKFW